MGNKHFPRLVVAGFPRGLPRSSSEYCCGGGAFLRAMVLQRDRPTNFSQCNSIELTRRMQIKLHNKISCSTTLLYEHQTLPHCPPPVPTHSVIIEAENRKWGFLVGRSLHERASEEGSDLSAAGRAGKDSRAPAPRVWILSGARVPERGHGAYGRASEENDGDA